MSSNGAFDWAALMRAAFQRLGMDPERFWRLTPAELVMLLGQDTGTPAMTQDGLAALMAAFPDKKEEG